MNRYSTKRLAIFGLVALVLVPASIDTARANQAEPVDPVYPGNFDDDWTGIASDIEEKLGISPAYVLPPAVQAQDISIDQTGSATLSVQVEQAGDPRHSFDVPFQEKRHNRYFLNVSDVPTGIEYRVDRRPFVAITFAPGTVQPQGEAPQAMAADLLDSLGIPAENESAWRSVDYEPGDETVVLRAKLSVACGGCSAMVYEPGEIRGANRAMVTFAPDGSPFRVESFRWIEPNTSRLLPLEDARETVRDIMEDRNFTVERMWFSHYQWHRLGEPLRSHWDSDARAPGENRTYRYSVEIDAQTGDLLFGPSAGIEGEDTGEPAGEDGTSDSGTSQDDVNSSVGTDNTDGHDDTSDDHTTGTGPDDGRTVPTPATGLFATLTIAIVGFNAWRRRRRKG